MDVSHLLSVSVTPVVLVSACGLITLALYNRLGAILARIRAFHQQKIELLQTLDNREGEDWHMLLLQMLDTQIAKVTIKAKTIQKGLYCLLSAVLAFFLCSVLSAAAVLYEPLDMVALAMHFLGLVLCFVGIGWPIRELTLSLTPLQEESAYLDILTTEHLARSQNRRPSIDAARAA